MPIVVLGFGSNLGNREINIREAYKRLEEIFRVRLTSSSFYETQPWGNTNQPTFINSVAYFNSDEEPHEILRTILIVEQQLGRKRNEKWGPRLIDIDLLLYGQSIIQTQDLIVPHPFLHNRSFVLKPLVEILPDYFHPVLKTPLKQLAVELNHS